MIQRPANYPDDWRRNRSNGMKCLQREARVCNDLRRKSDTLSTLDGGNQPTTNMLGLNRTRYWWSGLPAAVKGSFLAKARDKKAYRKFALETRGLINQIFLTNAAFTNAK